MSEPLFDKSRLTRRKEWVETSVGRLCVWELDVSDTGRVVELATRPSIDPRAGMDKVEAKIWLLALSCYYGEEPDAQRVWQDEETHEIRQMPSSVFTEVMDHVEAVNGKSRQQVETLRDFTEATGAPKPSE